MKSVVHITIAPIGGMRPQLKRLMLNMVPKAP
jgi:hypothetical protein